jgi:hypothetical protein
MFGKKQAAKIAFLNKLMYIRTYKFKSLLQTGDEYISSIPKKTGKSIQGSV